MRITHPLRIPIPLLTVLVAVLFCAAPAVYAAPQGGSAPDGSDPDPVVDGFTIDHLPRQVGPNVSEFAFEWADVTLRSKVWETGPDAEGRHRVDLTVKVMRGDRLTDLPSLRGYLAEYHEVDPATWELERFRHADGHCGRLRDGAVFWSVRPGVAIEVSADPRRISRDELVRTANGIHEITR